MPWNSTSPLGSVSVSANRTIGQQNTTYIETTMGNSIVGTNTDTTRDHFWNVGSDEDGRHRFINSMGFTVGGNPTDPVIGVGMDGVSYLKTILGTVQQFYRNVDGIYQTSPAVLTGAISIPSAVAYTNIVAVPANCYGTIFLYATLLTGNSVQTGFFRSDATHVEAWSNNFSTEADSNSIIAVKFGNGTAASGLNIRARRSSSGQTDYTYIIKYRAL